MYLYVYVHLESWDIISSQCVNKGYDYSLSFQANMTWRVDFPNPKEGWTAFFLQVTFPGLEDSVLEFTTQTHIIPDTYPFPECHDDACRGSLV